MSRKISKLSKAYVIALALTAMPLALAGPMNISNTPLFVTQPASPLTMLVMGKDHKLFYEAYNDASDLNGDGNLDVGYNPSIDYYGYFDSYKCYNYSGGRFVPSSVTANKKCNGKWSGDFLNYLTMTRMDALRKVLYGGYRSTDSSSRTILERAYVPQDAHSWGKEYTSVSNDGYNIRDYTPYSPPSSGRRILFANTTLLHGNGKPVLRVLTNETHRIWEWVSIERPVAGDRLENGSSGPRVSPRDYVVQVEVCKSGLLESDCKEYPDGNAKPVGLLQELGENDSMLFGLLTGSFGKNLSGGVLRKNVTSITDEIDPDTGQFTNTVGVVKTIDRLKIPGFGGNYEYNQSCGFIFNRPFNEGECRAWGNPIAEMMYESMRYFGGEGSPTSEFMYSGGDDQALGLPKATWTDPYATSSNNAWCAKPNLLVISDINPSYDTDQLPGSSFADGGVSSSITPGMNVSTLADTIWASEYSGSSSHFIGESNGIYDGAPSVKTVTGFSSIRGLAPEEPSKKGGYYSAAVAHYGWLNDVSDAQGDQKVHSYVVALASPLPKIEIPINGKTVTIVPFAKSVGGCGGINPVKGAFQPTNTIVDFYVESITPTSGTFRVNYEDAEQGADHDMDAIAKYSYTVNSNNTLTVNVESVYAAGCVIQHMGYVISGTNQDGTYLEVRDKDTSAGSDVDYFLDTPAGQAPGGNWNDSQALPLNATRTFTVGTTGSVATILKNPLWFAAKWGSFDDKNGNNIPDAADEWDSDNDGTPDNYFLVQNPLNLKEQLNAVLGNILDRSGSASSVSVNGGALSSSSQLFQSKFNTKDWSGTLLAYPINANGTLGNVQWDAGKVISAQNYDSGRNIITYKPSKKWGIPFRTNGDRNSRLDGSQKNLLKYNPDTGARDNYWEERVNYLRGSSANPPVGKFRERRSDLGDIVDSHATYVGAPSAHYYRSFPTGAAETPANYAAFKALHKNRKPVIYVGANDGMLHAIDASNGKELLAYVPNEVFPHLAKLTSPNYSHRYYVDGTPTVVDAYFGGRWRTILVGGLNNGGRGIYALDVTNPAQFRENNARNIVLWEYSYRNDRDMGYTYSQPAIVRMHNGQWAAVFGNGYNNTYGTSRISKTGNAVLYVVNLQTGKLIKKIDTKEGFNDDPTGNKRPNGLSSPAVVDVTGDNTADYIYAGDLFGNVWKFDVTSNNPKNWEIAYSGQPLFVAKDAAGNRQPITTRPTVGRANGGGVQLFFGTGKYLEPTDKIVANATTQTFYGVIDNNSSVITSRRQLLQQSILAMMSTYGKNIRVSSLASLGANQRGWYMDLTLGTSNQGERVITNAILRNDRLIFTTLLPSTDICAYGGSSYLMELSAKSGSRLDRPPFDVNGDGKVDSSDKVTYNVPGGGTIQISPSGVESTVGIISTPGIISAGEKEYKYSAGTSGAVGITTESSSIPEKRQSWRQLR